MSSSFPKDYSYSLYEENKRIRPEIPHYDGKDKPRILLMGLRRSGKSSIQKVVFHKMSPNETLFLESTNKIVKSDISNSSFVQFQCWDFPGQIDFFDPAFDSEIIFKHCDALIFVIGKFLFPYYRLVCNFLTVVLYPSLHCNHVH